MKNWRIPLGAACLVSGIALLCMTRLGSAASAPNFVPFTPKCAGYVSPIVTCNWPPFCAGCTASSTIVVTDGEWCEECGSCSDCQVSGGFGLCGTSTPPPSYLECGTRTAIGGTCPGGPGFGCILNAWVIAACGRCQ
jgi:hypothetical protein